MSNALEKSKYLVHYICLFMLLVIVIRVHPVRQTFYKLSYAGEPILQTMLITRYYVIAPDVNPKSPEPCMLDHMLW